MAAPSQEELNLLSKFRKEIKAADLKLNKHQAQNMYLLAWLRARDLSIPKALEMLKTSLEWRLKEDIDNVLSWKPPEYIPSFFPFEIIGNCINDECPIIVFPLGKWDIRAAVEAGDRDNFLRHVDFLFANAYEALQRINDARSNRSSHPASQCIALIDLEGFGYRQISSIANVQTCINCAQRFDANYPELVKSVYFINAPRPFSILFSIMKPFTAPKTLEKMEVYGPYPDKWKAVILKSIAVETLPLQLGGTNPDVCKFYSKDYDYGDGPSTKQKNGVCQE